jgi:hypothetical protein
LPQSCQQFKSGDFLVVRPLNWDEIIDKVDDHGSWAGPGAPSGGRSHPTNGNGNDYDEGEEETPRGVKWTGKE